MLKISKLKFDKYILEELIMFLVVFNILNSSILAFANKKYSILYFSVMTFINLATPFILAVIIFLQKNIRQRELELLIIPIIYQVLIVLNTYGGYTGNGFLGLAIFCGFLLFNSSKKIKLMDSYINIFVVICCFSLVFFALSMLNVNLLRDIVPYYNFSQNSYYYKYGIFAIYKSSNELRNCAIFNEPGGLGTLCALLLPIMYKRVKIWKLVIVALTGVTTFSLAFFILIFIESIALLKEKNILNKRFKISFNYKTFIIAIIVIVTGVVGIVKITNYKPIKIILSRLTVKDGKLKGDNRTSREFERLFNNFNESDNVFFGNGYKYVKALNISNTSSYKTDIVDFGYIGFILIYGSWLYFGIKRSIGNKQALLLTFLFFLSLYQRPNAIKDLWGYLILFGGIEYIKNKRSITSDKIS